MKLLFGILALFVCLGLPPASGRTQWSVNSSMHVAGDGGWDYLSVNLASHRLYVPRTTHTMVIDASRPRLAAQ